MSLRCFASSVTQNLITIVTGRNKLIFTFSFSEEADRLWRCLESLADDVKSAAKRMQSLLQADRQCGGTIVSPEKGNILPWLRWVWCTYLTVETSLVLPILLRWDPSLSPEKGYILGGLDTRPYGGAVVICMPASS
ncbi:8292_t:CDS:2 [Funneliformis mosseae]|uniref:8292_t:CDS:1 n=1 Tax=Funneliformis mosseae TaxID=27381 RepID=A0A9N9AK27_FUNMO|nr:8292_t:CDS:2 [Funneliformis mosseae]